ncbi:MAG TPA: beta-ketoacyl synthase N-terminal-like domain-containing protein, partial [Myxococcaceae bacterium]|nr:beta-ketoacyl synthase N-terminal-like domain-containing protein [Myxococcaceae bacterium]
MRLNEVVVTGLGVVLPNCDRRELFWQHLSQGQSQLTWEEDPSEPGRHLPMGRVKDFDPDRYFDGEIPAKHYRRYHREQQLYLASVILARRDARLQLSDVPPERVGIFSGTSRGNFAFWHERALRERELPVSELYGQRELMVGVPGQAANLAAAAFGIQGPTYTFNGTCSSGAIAIGHALREVQLGFVDVAFGTGHDCPLIAPLYQMYKKVELLSYEREDPRRAVRPFVGHSRNAFAEGAVTLVLENAEHARARGAPVLATLAGYQYGNTG